MPRPTSSTTIQRPDLGALAWEYMTETSRGEFIAEDVLPTFDVMEQSADYPVIPIEAILKVPSAKRAPRAAYARGDWEFETKTYACEEYGWEEPVDEAEANLYARFFDAETVSTEVCMDHIMRDREKRAAALLFNTANAVGDTAVTTEWSTAATATPKADVKAGVQAMRAASGLTPNAVVMSLKVMENVLNTTEIRDYLQYTSPHLVDNVENQRNMLARYFGVNRVLVGSAIEDTGKKGKAFSIADIWDDEYVSLCRLSDGGMRLREPVFGRSMLWTRDSPQLVVTESYEEPQTRSVVVRCRQNVDEAIQFIGANYLLTNITA